jgi:hypothetical protein
MATKKAAPKKKTTAKPVAKKKAAPKKKAAVAHKASVSAEPTYESFKLNRDMSFMNMRITRQTIYWTILLLFILAMQLWILNTQLDVLKTLDTLTHP